MRHRLGIVRLLVTMLFGSSCSQTNQDTHRLIYRDKNGRELTEANLANATGVLNWNIIGSHKVSQKALELHSQARRAGGSGDYKKALELLAQASKEAPEWPYPLYDAAYTYLLMGQPNEALESYEVVNKMAPRGFFTVQTAVHSLRLEKAKELQPGTYKQYVMLERVEDPVEKRALLEKMLKQSPSFAPAWKELSILLEDDTAHLQAIEEGLSHNPDDQTKGILLVNKALALNRQGKHEQAVSILGDLALDPDVPLDIEQIAKATLANVMRSR
jgi:tetratricopeptide (TPR) repeat protein